MSNEAAIKTRIEAMLAAISPSIGTVHLTQGFVWPRTGGTVSHWVVAVAGARETRETDSSTRLFLQWEIWGRRAWLQETASQSPGAPTFRTQIDAIKTKFRADPQLKNGGSTGVCELATPIQERFLSDPYMIYQQVVCQYCVLELTTQERFIVANA